MKGTRVLLILLGVLIYVPTCVCQNDLSVSNVLSDRILEFKLVDATIFEGLMVLSRADPSVALGYEEVLRAKDEKPPGATVRFTLTLENASVRGILDNLCNSDSRYTWSADGPVINVYPRATAGDPSYLLNRKLTRVQMKDVPDPFEALTPIARLVPDEQVAYAQVGGGETNYSKPWSATLEDVTVREVINRAAQQMGPRGSWIFHGSVDFRTFAFFKDAFSLVHPR